jgi:hypothetical protein
MQRIRQVLVKRIEIRFAAHSDQFIAPIFLPFECLLEAKRQDIF